VIGELHLVRRRLDEALAGLGELQASQLGGTLLDEWRVVEEAARIASRALRAAIAAAPAPRDDAHLAQISVGRLRVDSRLGRQWFGDLEFELTPLQHRLLAYMGQSPTRVISKEELRQQVWGDQSLTQTAAINVAVGKLRRQIISAGGRPEDWLLNVYGVGWSLVGPEHL
jgi:DNA-binding response OmpR family regulator